MRKASKKTPTTQTQQQLVDRAVEIWYSDERVQNSIAKEFEDVMAELKERFPEAHIRLHDEFEQELLMQQLAEEVVGGAYGW